QGVRHQDARGIASRYFERPLVDETCHLDDDSSGRLALSNPNTRAVIDWCEDQWRRKRQDQRLLGLQDVIHLDGTRTTDFCTQTAGVRIGVLEEQDLYDISGGIAQDQARDGECALCRSHGKKVCCQGAMPSNVGVEWLAGRHDLNGR